MVEFDGINRTKTMPTWTAGTATRGVLWLMEQAVMEMMEMMEVMRFWRFGEMRLG